MNQFKKLTRANRIFREIVFIYLIKSVTVANILENKSSWYF